jgi:hypothetical protein
MSPGRVRLAWMLSALLPIAAPAGAPAAEPPFPPATIAGAEALRERALGDGTAYALLRSLTTEVGPRLAGTDGDARAVAWAVENLKALGFKNVRTEPVTVSRWIRGEARVEIVAPWPQPLVAVALGASPPTPPGGLEAEVVAVTSLDELKTLDPAAVAGRVVYFSGRMEPARDGSGYGRAVQARGRGAAEAAKLGAVAMVLRSVGTSNDRVAHTGQQRTEGGAPPIPGLAISNPDADLLDRQLASGHRVRLRLSNTSSHADSAISANVIGEMPGRELPGEIVLLGAHLDSWDLGQGAHDDGAGVAIVMAAAKLAGGGPSRPRRTLRVVLFAAEETGVFGGRAYAREHAAEIDRHVLGMESDLGAFDLYGLASRVPVDRLPQVRAMADVLAPLGVTWLGNEAGGGADIGGLRELGMPVIDVRSDARPYFELHHTANDTFDKVDPARVREHVAAYAVLAWLAAESKTDFGRAPKPRTEGR